MFHFAEIPFLVIVSNTHRKLLGARADDLTNELL